MPAFSNGWPVKDILANIAAWEWRCAAVLNEAHLTDGLLKARPDIEALNREFYQDFREWGWVEVETYFRRAHQVILKAIQDLPPERFNAPLVQKTIASNTWEYYRKYLPNLERWHEQVTNERLLTILTMSL